MSFPAATTACSGGTYNDSATYGSSSTSGDMTAVSAEVRRIEALVLQSMDPSSRSGGPQAQQEANRALHELTTCSSDDGKCNVASLLMLVLRQSRHPHAAFFALTTLERFLPAMSPSQRAELRNAVLLFSLGSSDDVNGGLSITTCDQSAPAATSYLQNKVAMVLSKLALLDDSWDFVSDLLSLCCTNDMVGNVGSRSGNAQRIMLFLRTFDTLLQELAVGIDANEEEEQQQQQQYKNREDLRRVKNLLKGYDQGQQQQQQTSTVAKAYRNADSGRTIPLQILVDCVLEILQTSMMQPNPTAISALPGGMTPYPSSPVSATLACQTVKSALTWASFLSRPQLETIQQLLLVALQYLQEPQLELAALAAWQDFISNASEQARYGDGEDDDDNSTSSNPSTMSLSMLDALLERMHVLLPPEGESDAEIEIVIEVAKLIAAIGLEITFVEDDEDSMAEDAEDDIVGDVGGDDNGGEMLTATQTQLPKVLDLFFRAFRYDDIDVSAAVLPLAARLVSFVHLENSGSETVLRKHPHVLPQLVNVLYQQLKYPLDFGYDYEDEEDAEEELYRADLCKLYLKIVRAAPGPALEFVCQAVQSCMVSSPQQQPSLAMAPTSDVQAALRLVYHYSEGVRPAPGLKIVMQDESFCALVVGIHQSDIANHSHREVLCLYYDIAVRYYPIFKQAKNQELLHKVMAAMTGPQGLQHPHPRVRSRCCYLLLKLVKSVVKLLRPFVETAVTGINGILASNSSVGNSTDTTTSSDHDEFLQSEDTLYLFETMGHLLGRTGIDENLQQLYLTQLMTPHVQSMDRVLATPGLDSDVEYFGEVLSTAVAAMAHLSKGFSDPSDGVRSILVEMVRVTLRVLQPLAGSESVRNKSMVLVQRMIQCVGAPVLPFIPEYLHLLIGHSTGDDILFVSQIINQVCVKFKAEAVPVIDAALLPFLRKCHSLIPVQEEDSVSGLPPHLRTEQISVQKLSFAVLQHIVTHRATAVLISPVNVGSLETVLQTMLDGAVHIQDPTVKRTCVKFFRELVNQWGDVQDDVYRRGFRTYVSQFLVPGMLESFMDPSFDVRDAMQVRSLTEFSHVLFGIKSNYGDELYQQSLIAQLTAILGGPSSVPSDVLNFLRGASSAADIDKCMRELLQALKRGNNASGTLMTTYTT